MGPEEERYIPQEIIEGRLPYLETEGLELTDVEKNDIIGAAKKVYKNLEQHGYIDSIVNYANQVLRGPFRKEDYKGVLFSSRLGTGENFVFVEPGIEGKDRFSSFSIYSYLIDPRPASGMPEIHGITDLLGDAKNARTKIISQIWEGVSDGEKQALINYALQYETIKAEAIRDQDTQQIRDAAQEAEETLKRIESSRKLLQKKSAEIIIEPETGSLTLRKK